VKAVWSSVSHLVLLLRCLQCSLSTQVCCRGSTVDPQSRLLISNLVLIVELMECEFRNRLVKPSFSHLRGINTFPLLPQSHHSTNYNQPNHIDSSPEAIRRRYPAPPQQLRSSGPGANPTSSFAAARKASVNGPLHAPAETRSTSPTPHADPA